jgi:hypothetical protein
MAFPSVSAADTQSGSATSNSTTLTLTYPTNLASNDLILAFVGRDGGNVNGTWPADWVATSFNGSGSACNVIVAKKKSDGTETGNFNVTALNSEQGPWRVIRIPAAQWEGTIGTTFSTGGASDGAVERAGAQGSTSTPDPTSLDPFNWASEDTLWIAVAAWDGTPTGTGYPTNYTQEDHTTAGGHTATSGGAGGAGLAVSYRQLNASSEDPGTFTISASEQWAAITIAVRPAAAAAPRTPKDFGQMYQQLLAQ